MTKPLEPGYIECGVIGTSTGKPCERHRPIHAQCRLHERPEDELYQIAFSYCERTGFPMPEKFVKQQRESDREHKHQLWFVEFKLLGCNVGSGVQAARRIGISEDNAQSFADHARKRFK